ncbi:MAG TPA: alpha/beta fold hydrolase [Geopsychrobacteraceae bacterium]|nr:alpha/beta fold hydrolase [Geopsychrobacteraceae bacterium]
MAEHPPVEILSHRLADGRRLAWRQAGQGPALVMLHGWSMSGAVFQEVATTLSTDFQVFLPDLCGHGWSDPCSDYRLDTMADDLVDWLSAINVSGPALLGWSMGGQVAMQLAIQNRLNIARLLLISTTPCFCQKEGWMHGLPQTRVRTMVRQLKRAYLKTLGEFFDLQFAGEPLDNFRRRELLAFAVRDSRLPQQQDCIAALNLLGREDLRALVQKIDTPTLIMHGAQDQIIPDEAGQYLASEIPGAEFHLHKTVGHAPFMSSPSETAELWRRFLQ